MQNSHNKPKLYFIHFAGGSRYSFQFLTPYLKDFILLPLELPGRGNRTREHLLKQFDAAASDIYKQIIDKHMCDKFLIYGHSLGAYLALKVAMLLENAGINPTGIIVSGNPGPMKRELEAKKIYSLRHDEFIIELKKIGGIPYEVFEYKEIFDFYEPILRADFELSETNSMFPCPRICAPIYAMMGSSEEDADKIDNWGNFTKGYFGYELLKGGHFFIYDYPQYLASVFQKCYKAWCQ